MKNLIYIPVIVLSLSIFLHAYQDDEGYGLYVYFVNKIDTAHSRIGLSQYKEFDDFSKILAERLKLSSISANINPGKIVCIEDKVHARTPNELFSLKTIPDTMVSAFYLILGGINEHNQLIFATAKIYFVYQFKPIKFMELFELKTRYYHPFKQRPATAIEQIISEMQIQLKSGFDENVNIVLNSFKVDIVANEFSFLKNAVKEYLKSRLVISKKIKVYKDTITADVEGISRKPQYTIDAYIFDDRNRVHIIANCNDYNEKRVIISKQISFSIKNPDSLEIKLLELGDEFRNAVLNIHNSKTHKRRTKFALIANPPFFTNPENASLSEMCEINKKIIYSFISSIRTDTALSRKYEIVHDPRYFEKIEHYLTNHTELAVILNDLNAERLVVIQTVGTPNNFDLSLQIYNPELLNELSQVDYSRNINQVNLLEKINAIYTEIKKVFHDSPYIENGEMPSGFYRLIPNKLGIRLTALHSLFFKEASDLFLGNHLRPAVEIAGYYSFALWNIPWAVDISFMYDFGHFRDYSDYGDTSNHTGTVYGRNVNVVLKLYYPFYGRIKDAWRFYLGSGLTLIDIHRVSTRESAGSFDPGFIFELGCEYNFYRKFFVDFNARFLLSSKKFTTLDLYKDVRAQGHYRTFYLGCGLGYEF